MVAPFYQGLGETGYIKGQNLAIEHRDAEFHYDRLPALAADLVGRKVDVIVANGTPHALAAKSAISTIPIVFMNVSNPVGSGLVANLARPGGNATGFSILAVTLYPKRLELLSELVPHARVIALLVNPSSPTTESTINVVREAAGTKGLQLLVLKAASESEIDAAFTTLVQLQAGALISAQIGSSAAGSNSSRRWHHIMPLRRSEKSVDSPQPVAWLAMEPSPRMSFTKSAFTPEESSKARNRPICRSSSRPNSRW